MSFRKFGRLFCWLIKPNPFHVATAGKINVPRYQSSEKQGNNRGGEGSEQRKLDFFNVQKFCVCNKYEAQRYQVATKRREPQADRRHVEGEGERERNRRRAELEIHQRAVYTAGSLAFPLAFPLQHPLPFPSLDCDRAI